MSLYAVARRCDVDGCNGRHKALGLCAKHYAAHKRTDPAAPQCMYCDRPAEARNLCNRHYHRWRVGTLTAGRPTDGRNYLA